MIVSSLFSLTSLNEIIHKLYRMRGENKDLPLNRFLPEEPAEISLLEVTKDNALIGQFTEYVKL